MLSTFAYKNLIDADPPFGHFYIKATSFPRIFDVTLSSQGIHQLREAAQGVWLLIGNNSFCRVNGPERRGYDFYFYSSSLFLTLCANQEWGHIYIYTHTVLTFFEGSFVELIEIGRTRSFLSPHKVGEMSWRGLGSREAVGRDCQWISLSNAVSGLFEIWIIWKRNFLSFLSWTEFYFRYCRRVDLLCDERGSLRKRFRINLISFKRRFRVIEFGSHEKGIFFLWWISFLSRYCQVQFNLLHRCF